MCGQRLIRDFDEASERCADLAALGTLLGDAARELGFAFFALLHHASLARPAGGLLRLDSYPAGWAEEIVREDLAGVDPVHHACSRTNLSFAWDELPCLTPIGGAERAVLERAARHGLGAGFTVPVNIPGEPAGSCSFAMRRGVALPRRALLSAEQLGAHAFAAARRLTGWPRQSTRPHLSRRERQCLRLLAGGKTDWVIARILGISPETTHQYVKRARAAYGVASRTQLVACGLRDAVISYEDAIPPGR